MSYEKVEKVARTEPKAHYIPGREMFTNGVAQTTATRNARF